MLKAFFNESVQIIIVMNQCIVCNKVIRGRNDKKFCSKDCNNKFHNGKRKNDLTDEVKSINKILLKNRRILQQLCEKEKKYKLKVSKLLLSHLGFNFSYITGIYYNRQGKMYHYVYDYAWMEFSTQDVMIIRKRK